MNYSNECLKATQRRTAQAKSVRWKNDEDVKTQRRTAQAKSVRWKKDDRGVYALQGMRAQIPDDKGVRRTAQAKSARTPEKGNACKRDRDRRQERQRGPPPAKAVRRGARVGM